MSRNQREGRYAGKLYAHHWRSRYYRRPGEYTAAIAPYMAAVADSRKEQSHVQ
jgi:hypothetical protein